MATARAFAPRIVVALLFAFLPVLAHAQYVEQNVNMVAGTDWPNGDPYLQRQNEPSVAISTRNSQHLVAGTNDYRSVDVPFDTPASPDSEERGDAWLGVFKSRNGGQSWWSNLLEGYPQQASSTSPLHGYQAAADPVVRSGPNGMFYFAGLVLNRDPNPLGAVFVARFIDNNNTENGDPFGYLGATLVDKGTSGAFLDKPWVSVGPGTGTCTVTQTLGGKTVTQTFPGQNVYLAYTAFVGGDNNIRTKLMFARSTNCGQTWSAAQKLSEGYPINQGAQIVVSPTGPIYVVWRRFKTNTDSDAIMVAKSLDQGQTFSKATVVRTINPFEQGMTFYSIRTNAYPAATTDASGRLYIAWADRGFNASGDGRIMLVHSPDAVSWSNPIVVDPGYSRGHQFMPTMTSAGGKVVIAYYDLRDDSTIGVFTNLPPKVGNFLETRQPVSDLPAHPEFVFLQYLLDQAHHRRHTLDLRAAQGSAGPAPVFDKFARVSRYVFGSRPPGSTPTLCLSGEGCVEQLQFNVPNLPLFRLGTAPFIGDYIDIVGYSPKSSGVYHVVWTDNRDVRPPLDGNWANYTPVQSSANTGTSKFNGQTVPPCAAGQSGMRNQNIYTTRLTDGIFAGSAGNAKQLGVIERAFAVFAQNATGDAKSFRFTILTQPPGGKASFNQGPLSPLSTVLDAPVPAHSTATRTVYISSTDPHATVGVDVTEVSGTPPVPVANGLTTTVAINPDVSNPDVSNPDVSNPDVSNPDVSNPDVSNPDVSNSEVHNPDVSNPDVSNPDVSNPDVSNPDVSNPDVSNPDVSNPDVSNPDVSNPDVSNPDVSNPDVSNTSVTDTTWTTNNKGNTTSGYGVKLVSNTPVPNGVRTQLIVHRIQQTPIATNANGYSGCGLTVQKHSQIISNIIDPVFTDAGLLTTPDPADATLWLAPGDGARITLRVYGGVEAGWDPAVSVAPVVVAQANNNINGTIDQSPSLAAPLFITTTTVKDAVYTQLYTQQFDAIGGTPPYTWTSDPASIDNTGLFTYQFPATGPQPLIVTVHDSDGQQFTKTYTVRVFDPLVITTQSLPTAITGQPYNATVTAQGGLPPYTFSNYKVSFPSWLSINGATGQLSGTPPLAGSSAPAVEVVDSANPQQSAVAQWALNVADPLVITTTSLPNGRVDTPYLQSLNSTGGLAPVTWSLANGSSLPAGLNLGSGGTISGTPTASGTTATTFVATDASSPQQTKQATFSILIASNNIQFAPQPSNIVTGQDVTGGVRVTDNQGAALPGVNVTITIGKNPGNTVINPYVFTTNASGIGAFSIPGFLVGTGYTLIATVTVGPDTFQEESQPFNVDPSFNIQWSPQPASTPAGQPVSAGVRVTDLQGAAIPGALVNITLGQNPGNSSIGQINVITNVDGQASFQVTGLNVGSGYTLIAKVSQIGFGTITAESQPFNVTP